MVTVSRFLLICVYAVLLALPAITAAQCLDLSKYKIRWPYNTEILPDSPDTCHTKYNLFNGASSLCVFNITNGIITYQAIGEPRCEVDVYKPYSVDNIYCTITNTSGINPNTNKVDGKMYTVNNAIYRVEYDLILSDGERVSRCYQEMVVERDIQNNRWNGDHTGPMELWE